MAVISFEKIDEPLQKVWPASILVISGYYLIKGISFFRSLNKSSKNMALLSAGLRGVPPYKIKNVPIATFKRNFQLLQNEWERLRTDLNKFCSDFLKEQYGIEWNNELYLMPYLDNVQGHFVSELEHVSKEPLRSVIYLNEDIAYACLEYNTSEIAFEVLKHELVHYAMFVLGRQYHDGEYDFEEELKRLKIASNQLENTTSYKCYVHRIDGEQSVVKVFLSINKYTKNINFDEIVLYYRELIKKAEG